MEGTKLLIVLWIVTGGCTWLCTVGVTDVVRGPVQVNDVVCNTVQRTDCSSIPVGCHVQRLVRRLVCGTVSPNDT